MTIATTTNLKNAVTNSVDTCKLQVVVSFDGSTWTDISDYVQDAGGRCEETSVSQGANANSMDLVLINDDGRFSPRNTASPYSGNLLPYKQIKASIVVGSDSIPIFTGFTSTWKPSAKARTCALQSFDAAYVLKRNQIISELCYNQTTPANGVTWNWVFERAAWLSGIRWDTVSTYDATFASTSQVTYNPDGSVASTSTITVNTGTSGTAVYTKNGAVAMRVDIIRSAAGASLILKASNLLGYGLDLMAALAQVVDGHVFFDAQGALRMRSRMYLADSSTPAETITVDHLDDSNYAQNYEGTTQVPIYNRCTITSQPLDFYTDSSGNLLEESVTFSGNSFPYRQFNAGQVFPGSSDADQYANMPSNVFILKTASYPTPDKFSIISVDNADQTKKLGSSGIVWTNGYPVFSTNRVKMSLTNKYGSAAYLQDLTLKVKLAAPRQTITAIQSDVTSIQALGQRDKTISNSFVPDNLSARNLADWVVQSSKNIQDVLSIPTVHGYPWLELGDTVSVSETITNTVPAATNYVIRAWTWKYTPASYTQTFECVPPAVSFSLQTNLLGMTEVSNTNTIGQKAGSVPPKVIDNTPSLVGVNNTPVLTSITNNAKAVPAGTGISTALAIGFDGSNLYVAQGDGGRVINRMDTMTGATGSWTANSLNSTDWIYAAAISGSLIFITDTNNKTIQVGSTTAATGQTLTSKASLSPRIPYEIFFIGSKMYVTTMNSSTNLIEICVWNSISTTTQSTPDATYSLGTSGYAPVRATTDGTNIYVPVGSAIASFNTSTNAVTSNILSSSTSFSPGCFTLAWDGLNIWAGVSYNGTNGTVVKLVPSSNGLVAQSNLPTYSYVPVALLYDGTYIWASVPLGIYQISTSNVQVANFKTNAPQGGFFMFDGFAIWQTGLDANIYRVPRLVSGRQF